MVVSGSSSRARPTLVSGMPKTGRSWSLMQIIACGIFLAVTLVITYMFRVIQDMHSEQKAMRFQIATLTGSRSTGSQSLRAGDAAAAGDAVLAQEGSGFTPVEEVGGPWVDVGFADGRPAERRRLSWMGTTGTTAMVGCYTLADASTITHKVSTTNKNDGGCGTSGDGHECPDCFTTSTMSQNIALTIENCKTAKYIRDVTRNGIWQYTFINPHATHTLSVTDNSASTGRTTYNIPPGRFVQAYCASALGTDNRLYWPSDQLPTLTVDSGLTLSSGNFDASNSPGTFKTSTGAHTINGATTISGTNSFATGSGAVALNGHTSVANSKTFTVGSAGNGGDVTLFGDTTIGAATPNTNSLTVNGNVAFANGGTFATAAGAITLNGDVAVASGKNIAMDSTGDGTFTSGTGDVTLNGHVKLNDELTSSNNKDITFNGDTYILNGQKLEVGSPGTAAGTSKIYGALEVGGSASGKSASFKVYGDVEFANDADGTAKTFTSATGAITLNGDVEVTEHNDLHMTATSTGTFQTGVGNVAIYGNLDQKTDKTFATGTGAVTLRGTVGVADGKHVNVGSAGNGGSVNIYGPLLVGHSDNGASTTATLYADVTIKDDGDSGEAKNVLKVEATGTHEFYGKVKLADAVNFEMTGASTFTSGTGAVTLYGDTTVVVGPAGGTARKIIYGAGEIECNTAAIGGSDKTCRISG